MRSFSRLLNRKVLRFTVQDISVVKGESCEAANDSRTSAVLREWRTSARYWQKHVGTIRMMFQPVTEALIKEADLAEGDDVLDVAGGSGEPSLTIAETVGPNGSVMCTDAVAEMVIAAQSEAQRRGLTNVKFRQCAADSLPFDDDVFDAVVCRLGVMFFPDPLAALREMLRVAKRGGVLCLAVWSRSDHNPFSYGITNVVERYFEPAAPMAQNASDAFRFAEPGSLAGILKSAGAIDVKERELQFQIAAPISPKEFWEMRSETSGTLRERLEMLTVSQRVVVAKQVEETVCEFFPNNQMAFPAEMIIATGGKP